MRLSQLTAVRWSWKLPANCGAVRSHDLLGERCICWGGGLSLCVDLSASKGQVAAAGGDGWGLRAAGGQAWGSLP